MQRHYLALKLTRHLNTVNKNTLVKALEQMYSNKEIRAIYNVEHLIYFGKRVELRSDGEIKAADIYTALANENHCDDTRGLMSLLSFNNPDNEFAISIPAPGKPSEYILPLNNRSKDNPENFTAEVLMHLKRFTLDPALEAGAIICVSNHLTTNKQQWHGRHYIKLAFLEHNEEFRFVVRRGSKTYIDIKQAIDANQESDSYITEARKQYPNHVVMQYIEQDHRYTASKGEYELLSLAREKVYSTNTEMLVSHLICDRF
ncbi:hypothetical protein Q4489_18115 [Thalassotalea sp. 1_MG-2023]|uniref:hypothetical protein n=1 Tax=Thalassotalea sp. 1_MG-2023 TaxID=3062680 RepID=UPI0026E29611|nr:hypothetical protein [Thalassotalea sp. 1_MG-2023]MDO6428918.1 hypothetical protein [Thalassotalea sp. 1_MG-2023]